MGTPLLTSPTPLAHSSTSPHHWHTTTHITTPLAHHYPHHAHHWHTTTHAVSILQVAYLGTAVAIPFSVPGNQQYPPTRFCSFVAVKESPNIPDIYLGYFSISHLGLSLLEAILFCAQLFVLYKLRKRGYFRFFNSVWWLLGLPLLLANIGELLTTTLSIKSQSNQSVLIKVSC